MSFETDRRLARLVMPLGVTLLLGVAIGWGLSAWGVGADVDMATSSGTDSLGEGSWPALRSAWPTEGALASRLGGGPGPVDQSTDSAPGGASRVTPVVEAVRRVLPSVVSVSVYRHERARARSLLDLFGPARDRVVAGLGSGFLIDDQGTILTNDHVVNDADSILIVDVAGRTYTAAVVGRDELTDLAVLHIEPGRIPPAPLGRSSDLMVGEPAIAIGVPYGSLLANSEATVTRGVISGVDRDIRSTGRRQVLYADMVQTDASINPGNSGGPLVNIRGEVIGVNSWIFSSSGGSQGLGFAIPIDRALRVAAELRDFGRIRRPWVGVDLATMPSDSFFSVATVRRVAPNSPAASAGLLEGDVILSLDGRAIRGALDWEIGLLDAGVNEDVQIRFVRGTQQHNASLRIEELPSERADRIQVLRGLELVTVTEGISVERDLSVGGGALIVRIDDVLARRTGMRVDDVIVAINRREVRSAEEARDLLLEAARRGWVELLIGRQGATLVTSFPIRR
ncbi:MAG: trypsin-like peptidase domain-containing protein [Gemmatimonadota bacterium]